MPTPTRLRVIGLWRYPIKSCQGEAATSLPLDRFGFAMDRRFMLVDPDTGVMIRQDDSPVLAKFAVSTFGNSVTVRFGDEEPVLIPYAGMGSNRLFRHTHQESPLSMRARIWKSTVDTRHEGCRFSDYFSERIKRPCMLVSMGRKYDREVTPKYGRPGDKVGFADAYPVSFALKESFDDLNRRIRENGGEAVPLDRFRPNILLEGADGPIPVDPRVPEKDELGDRMVTLPEDTWRNLVIRRERGPDDTFRSIKPVSRCPITMQDQHDGSTHGGEPLHTLGTYRFKAKRRDDPDPENKVLFCQYAIHDFQGDDRSMVIKIGDIIEAY